MAVTRSIRFHDQDLEGFRGVYLVYLLLLYLGGIQKSSTLLRVEMRLEEEIVVNPLNYDTSALCQRQAGCRKLVHEKSPKGHRYV